MGILGIDSGLWQAIDDRIRTFFAKDATRRIQVQVAEVGTGDNAGKVKVRDPEGGFSRDVFYPQTNPNYIPTVDDWTWALTGEGGLLILSPEPGSPIGATQGYAGTTDPPGGQWFIADGRTFVSADYPVAASVLGTAHNLGGEAPGTFRIPNMRSRTLVGVGQGTGLTNRVMGGWFGEENHLLGITEMPNHSHTASGGSHAHTASGGSHSHTASAPGHSHGGSTSGGGHEHSYTHTTWDTVTAQLQSGTNAVKDFLHNPTESTSGGGRHSHGLSTDSQSPVPTINAANAVPTIDAADATPTIAATGGGGVHNNMQPSLGMNFIIRLA